MTRRLLLALAIALAVAGGYALLRSSGRPAALRSEPHADIDEASRARLQKILEDADRREAGAGEAARKEAPAR